MAKLLVVGASRGIGLETVKAALRAGHNVRALARSARGIPIQDPALDKVTGNALDSETVRDALEDVDAVIQTLGVAQFSSRRYSAGWPKEQVTFQISRRC